MDRRLLPGVYRRFAAIGADGEPIRTERELAAMMRAAGKSAEDATDEWLRSLPRAWVYGWSDGPFADERANRLYRRELEGGE